MKYAAKFGDLRNDTSFIWWSLEDPAVPAEN